MASTRVIPGVLRTAPIATLALLFLWATLDVLSISASRGVVPLLEALAVGAALLILAAFLRWTWARPFGLAAAIGAYVGAHAFFLGVQVVPALVFLVILICHVELRILAERFAPLYEATLTSSDRARIRKALGRATLRLAIASVLAVVVPILAANLAVAGVVTFTSIPTAIFFAGALVAVVLVIAILPSLERRTVASSADHTSRRKDN